MATNFRVLFPITQQLAYLDNAAVGPISTPVHQAMTKRIDERRTIGTQPTSQWDDELSRLRGAFARAAGGSPQRTAILSSTSEALGVVAEGFPWKPGDNVVIPAGEFPANRAPWTHLRRRQVDVRIVPREADSGRHDAATLLDAVDARTRMVAVSAVRFDDGWRAPLEELQGGLTGRDTLLVVDAIQALGAVPIDLEGMKLDVVCGGGHKWLLGPQGIAGLTLSRRAANCIEPVLVGWNSLRDPWDFDATEQPLHETSRRFERSFPPLPEVSGLGAALDLLLAEGLDRLAAEVRDRVQYLLQGLKVNGFTVRGPDSIAERGSIVTVELARRADAREVCAAIRQEGVVASVRRGGLRFAPHAYNNEDDLNRALGALGRALGSRV